MKAPFCSIISILWSLLFWQKMFPAHVVPPPTWDDDSIYPRTCLCVTHLPSQLPSPPCMAGLLNLLRIYQTSQGPSLWRSCSTQATLTQGMDASSSVNANFPAWASIPCLGSSWLFLLTPTRLLALGLNCSGRKWGNHVFFEVSIFLPYFPF